MVAVPAWLQVECRAEASGFSDHDRAFLESVPAYEDESIVAALFAPVPPEPSLQRRMTSLALFTVVAGSAFTLLILAALRSWVQGVIP